jgi:glycosyltransferase involved in cell wall biosynthesis
VRANTWQVINNGISPAVINTRSRTDLRVHLGLEENDILLLQVARLHPHKGQRLLLEAVQPLLDKYSHVKLLFVGRGCDKLPTNSQIHVVDGSDDLAPFYNAADWLINPSLSESFPTVVLEAMSYGIPVVATDVGGTRELLDQAGVLVAATSTDLMLAIDKVIRMDSQERNHYVAAGLERSSQFSFKRMVTNYTSAYRQIFEASEKRSG